MMTGITILVIILFLMWVDWDLVRSILQDSDWHLILLANLCLLAGLGLYTFRWRIILRRKAGFWQVFKAASVGQMVNILVPLRAGEAARIWMLSSSTGIPLAEVTSSIVVERMIEQILRILTLGGAIAFGAGLHFSPVTIGGALATLALAFGSLLYLLRNRQRVLERLPAVLARIPYVEEDSARHGLESLLDGLASLTSARSLAIVMLWSCGMWLFFWGYQFFTLAALNLPIENPQVLALTLGALALSPPSAPTQPGIYHASISVVLSVLKLPPGTLPVYTLILHLEQMVWMVGFGAWGMLTSQMHLGNLLGMPSKSTEALKD